MSETYPSIETFSGESGNASPFLAYKAFLAWCSCYFLVPENDIEFSILSEVQQMPDWLLDDRQVQSKANALRKLVDADHLQILGHDDYALEQYFFHSRVIETTFNPSVSMSTLRAVCQEACNCVLKLILNKDFNADRWPGGYYYMIDDPIYQQARASLCRALESVLEGFMNSKPATLKFEVTKEMHQHIKRVEALRRW